MKTLKDIQKKWSDRGRLTRIPPLAFLTGYSIAIDDVKEEAVEWVNFLRKRLYKRTHPKLIAEDTSVIAWIEYFFDIETEDLQ